MLAKLYDSELKVMRVLWRQGTTKAREIAEELTETTGWNINTTYTIIKRCMKKGAIERKYPGFQCIPLVTKEEVQRRETEELINKMFEGSSDQLFASLVENRELSVQEIQKIKNIVEGLE